MSKTKFIVGVIASLITSSSLAVPVVLDILFDDMPSETAFGIWDNEAGALNANFQSSLVYDVDQSSDIGFGDGRVFPGDFDGVDNGPWQFVWDLDPGEYFFAIFDVFGDGICCDLGNGGYSLTVNGLVEFSGGDFNDIDPVGDNGEYMGAFIVEEVSSIVEPASLTLLGLGLIGIALIRRRR